MDKATVAQEARAYLAWLAELERGIKPGQAVVSRHYRSQRLTAYSRYSLLKVAVQGAPSICVADITVEQPGCGFFTALCDQFQAPDCPILAQVLFVENVGNQRFVGFLERRGFRSCASGDPKFPSLYLVCNRVASTRGPASLPGS